MDTTSTREVGGRYRLLAPLGSGGMGTVWRAEDAVLGRQVAVKEVVFPHGLSDAEREVLRERTRREARAAARLDHPSAVTVYDVVEEDGQPFLVLELVEARTLAEAVRQDGPLTPQRTAEVGLAVLGALEAAHARGIVHRDVKPSNVLLGTSGRIVLTDFGIATSTGDPSITSTGLLLGSPSYISPERARGGSPGPASDLWALGATLFTAVEGRAPYDKGEPLPTMTAVVTGDREPYRAAGPLVPVLDGLLEPDPERRLDSAGARRMLEQVARSAPSAAPLAEPSADGGRSADRTAALAVPPRAEPLPAPDAGSSSAAPPPPAAPAPVQPAPSAAPWASRPSAPSPAAPAGRRVPLRPPAPEPTRRRRRGPLLALLALALVGLLGAGLAAGLLDGGGSPAGAPAPSAGAPGGGAEDDTGDGTGSGTARGGDGGGEGGGEGGTGAGAEAAAEVPEGWRTDELPSGSVVAVPASYERSQRNATTVQYRDPDTRRTLRVQVLPGGGREDAVADREAAAAEFAQRYPSYREIGIEEVDYRGDSGADWEFTYSDDGADLHVLNRVFQVEGTGFSLFFQTPESEWQAAQDDLEGILATFRPQAG